MTCRNFRCLVNRDIDMIGREVWRQEYRSESGFFVKFASSFSGSNVLIQISVASVAIFVLDLAIFFIK